MRRLFKWAALLVLALALGVIGGGLYVFNATVPQYAGQLRLSGPRAPITITRDANGIAHIRAQSMRDAWFAVGFVHAQDRFWQMHINRMIASGRLSEVVGKAGLATDRFLRTLGMRKAAESAYAALDGETKRALEAYAAGVNVWLKRAGRFPTPEFYTLMLPRPDPFSPVDSVAWLKMMAWDLGGNWRHELERLRLAAKMPMRRVFEVKPPYPGETAPKLPELRDLYGFPLKVATGPLLDEKRFAAIIRDNGAAGVGSNNWVLAPSRTTSGRAILANDPHLNLTTPSVWYYLRVSVPEENFDVIGATLPGVPFVVLGRNRHLAWGFTNTGPDVQDLFVERLSDRPGHYDAPDGPRPFVTRTETIRVRFGRDVTITVRETRHGPVISDALPDVAKLFGGRAVLAFQWTALMKTDGTISALRRLGAVKTMEEFRENARGFVAPQQNIVYADMQGNIGYIAPGKVPLRKQENPLRGLLPAPGWDATYDWAGFIPFEELPQVVNPPSGVVITANQKVVGPDYPHHITGDWTLPYRYDRIRALIEEKQKHDVESVKRIQTDVTSLFVRDLLPVMLKHIAGMEEFAAVRALLSEWDGAARADGAEMLIFAVWHDRLLEMVLREEHPNPTRKNRLKPRFLKNVLTNLNGQGVWCANALKDTSTDKCPQLVAEALRVALADIRGQFGDDMRNWRWGEAHAAVFEHRPLGRFPLFDKWFNVRVERNGGPHTVNVSNYKTPRMGLEFATTHAASLRHIFEMGQGGANLFIFAPGQAGHLKAAYFEDLKQDWAKGRYRKLPFGGNAPQAGRTLKLLPRE